MPNNADTPPVPLLMTRARDASEAFVAALPDALRVRLTPVFSPLLDIVPRDGTPEIAPDDAALFTSANGVRYAPAGAGRRAFCVGQATTDAAEARGWKAQMAGQDADALVAELTQNPSKQRLFHLSGAHTRGQIVERLRDAGMQVTHHVLYDQHLCPLTDAAQALLTSDAPLLIPLFSPRTAAHLATTAPGLHRAHIIALSPAVAAALGDVTTASLRIAQEPDATAMHCAIGTALDRLEGGGAAE